MKTLPDITPEELEMERKLKPKCVWLNNLLFRLYVFWHKHISK